MKEEADITFYNIDKCGYFKYGKDLPEFGNVADTFKELKEWTSNDGMTLGETCTYEITESEDILRTFCFALVKNASTGDYLLTTWNETPSTEGNVASVEASKPVGEAEVSLTELPAGSIPGYATYFWIIPSHNILATIRFNHRLNGHKNLNKYLNEFIAKWTKHVVVVEDEEVDHNIVGYSNSIGDEVLSLHPIFKSSLHKKPGQSDYLKNNISNIIKMIRKNKLVPNVQIDTTLWQSILQTFGLACSTEITHDVKIKYEIPYSPSIQELDDIISEWDSSHNSKWDDVGFKLTGETETYWLSHSISKETVELDVNRENAEVVNGESLLSCLSNIRSSLISLL
jgi:hypothetical protein